MSSILFKNFINEFNELDDIDSIKKFFKKYDFMIVLIPCLRMKDFSIWVKLWSLKYDLSISYNDLEFYEILKVNNINNKEEFIIFANKIYDKILTNSLEFSKDNDISVIISNKPLSELISVCKEIKIHKGDDTRGFIQENCLDTIYFYRATKENKLYNNILYNEMMKNICISFLNYLEEEGNI